MQQYNKEIHEVLNIAVQWKKVWAWLRPRRVLVVVPVRTTRKHRGQALVEFLIVLPVLLLTILGLVAVGQLLLANYTVNQAARAAAHQAAIAGGEPNAAYVAADNIIDAGIGTDADRAVVAVDCDRSPCRRYDAITVDILYTDRFWTPIPGFSTFEVRSSATRAAERDQQ